MRREFIVARIEASQDGSPYVYVTFNDPKEYKPDRPNMNPFGQNVTSIEDLMKNMPKVITNIGFMGPGLTDSPTIKFSIMNIRIWGSRSATRYTLKYKRRTAPGASSHLVATIRHRMLGFKYKGS